MTENGKTGLFVGTAALLGLLAWVSTPRQISNKDEIESTIGKSLFTSFSNPTDVASLKIVKFDEELGTIKKFDLNRDSKSGAWVIPSHDSYPADAASQISKVANAFIDLKALTVASKSASDHKSFGVIEPDDSKTQVGETGLGTLVSMENQKGEVLVNLVIGKEVRDDPKQRYVRRTGSDAIFATEIDPSILSTDFATWIEGDLLKLSSNDIASMSVRDYSIVVGPGGRGVIKKNFNADVDYSTTDNKWNAKSIQVFDKATPSERKLADDEELNATKLNEIKNTLDSLKIADVARKPKGLAADLKADKTLLDDQAAVESLNEKGFYPVPSPDGKTEIYSASGEMAFSLKDGVTYLLRFGEAFGSLGGNKEGSKDAEANSGTFYRTLFVTANLDESVYPMPELQAVPQTIEEMKALEAKEKKQREEEEAADKSAAAPMPVEPPKPPVDTSVPDEKPAAPKDTTPDALKPAENKLEKAAKEAAEAKIETSAKEAPKSDASANEPVAPEASPTTPETKPAETPPATDNPKPADSPKPESNDQSYSTSSPRSIRLVSTQADGKETKTEEAKAEVNEGSKTEESKAADKADAADNKPAESKSADAKEEKSSKPVEAKEPSKTESEKPAPAKEEKKPDAETADELKEKLAAVQERITKDNTRLLDDRKDRMETARKKAAELNARFADWYYEISDNEYKRIRLTLEDLIKKKTPATPAGNMQLPPQ